MNKIYLITAAFAVMASLSGCSDTELASIDTAQEKTPIGFHTVGSQMGSRATIINAGDITKTDFKVYAFDDAGNAFMGKNDASFGFDGVEINHKTGKWDYANSADCKYWPDYPLNFYAVSPGTFEDQSLGYSYSWKISNDEKKIKYQIFDEYSSENNPQSPDVMYAVAEGQKKSNGKVKLSFKHILSRIAFQAMTNDPNLKVEINEIKLCNVKYSGTFTLPAANTAPATKDWEVVIPALGSHSFTVIKGAKITVNSTTVASEISNSKPMTVIPQQLTAWQTNATTAKTIEAADNAEECYLKIYCKIKVKDEYKIGDASKYDYIYVPFGDTWEPGKRYLYTLIFGGGYDKDGKAILIPVNFTADTKDWNDGNDPTNGKEIPLYQQQ